MKCIFGGYHPPADDCLFKRDGYCITRSLMMGIRFHEFSDAATTEGSCECRGLCLVSKIIDLLKKGVVF
jgi:hypothetical protein